MANRRKRGNRSTGRLTQSQAVEAAAKSLLAAGDDFPARGNLPVNLSQFDAANSSMRRGEVFMPSLDTRRDLNRYTREEMMRESRWCQDNVGLAGRAVDGMAELVGYQMPLPKTKDNEWNDDIKAHFADRCENASVFDRAGKLTFSDWQIEMERSDGSDGDSCTVLTENSNRGAQIAFYEAHQMVSRRDKPVLRSGSAVYEERDGVVIHRRTGRAAYHLLVEDMGDRRKTQVSRPQRASDCIFSANYTRHNRVRGITRLHRAVNHILDITELTADLKSSSKAAAQLAFYLTGAGKFDAPMHPIAGMGNAVEVEPDGSVKGEGEGSDKAQRVSIEQVLNSSYALDLKDRRLEMVHDTRPHPNQLDFINQQLVRDIAWGYGVAPEILWMMSGLTGPGVRFVMANTSRWISERLRRRRAHCQRFWVYWLAKEFARGTFRRPNDPHWWRCGWLPLADLTIDRGRDGLLALKSYERGASTLAELYADKGMDWDDAIEQRAAEISKAKATALKEFGDENLWRELLPPPSGAPGELWLPGHEDLDVA